MKKENSTSQAKNEPVPAEAAQAAARETHHHSRIRRFFAWVFALAAINFILLGIFVLWAQNLLTDTPRYVSTVAPLSEKPKVQELLKQQTTNIIIDSAPIEEISQRLLPAGSQRLPVEEQKKQLRPIIERNVSQIIISDDFSRLWRDAHQQAHSQLLAQLEDSSSTGVVDLSSLVKGAVELLRPTQLGFMVNELEIPADAGKLQLEPTQLDSVQRAYSLAQKGILALLVLAAICLAVALLISDEKIRTLRHIAAVTAISAAIVAVLLSLPTHLKFGGADSRVTQEGFSEISRGLFGGLQMTYLWTAIISAMLAVGLYLWQRRRVQGTVVDAEQQVKIKR